VKNKFTVEMIGLLGRGNNHMVGVSVKEAMNKKILLSNNNKG
jgi:hypothetical protein